MTWHRTIIETRTIDGETLTASRAFFDRVNFTDTCWFWTGANNAHESRPNHIYGHTWDGKRHVRAHRYAYKATGGQLAPRQKLDHLCRRTLCVRPSHLEPTTQRQNFLRGESIGARAIRLNVCKRNHELTPENTYVRPDGSRTCRACIPIRKRERAYL